MDLKNFRNFVDEIQRDPRLNETLYPKMSENQALNAMIVCERNEFFSSKSELLTVA